MIGNHYLTDAKYQRDDRVYDVEALKSKANEYVETRIANEGGYTETFRWDLCDVGAHGIQLRCFIGKSSMMSIGDPTFTIKYDMSNLDEVLKEFVDYYIDSCQRWNATPNSNPTRFQEEQFAKYGCE